MRLSLAGGRSEAVVRSNSAGVRVWRRAWLCAALLGTLIGTADASALPQDFEETTAFSGLTNPTVVRFAAGGRVLVAEKSGLVKSFSGPSDTSADVVADLRTQVHNFWDRGLLGMVLDPSFASNQRIYVLYTHDAEIGASAPHWGTAGATSDGCPTPPGPTGDGCVVSGRLSRLTLNGTPNPPETVLIEDWCQQYPSHSVGNLEFGADGALYASAGDGASFNFTDYGQGGNPINPCGDPPLPPGGALTPPTAEGGALRSQDLRTPLDPVGLDGTVIRVDPATGAALPSNPNAGSTSSNARRIIAHGMRNPFRFAISPDDELWIGDVGWNSWEELNRMPSDPPSVVNFGWPCYEGNGHQGGYDGADLNICESLYAAAGAVTAPRLTYNHSAKVAGESCPTGSSSVAGVDFYEGGPFPAAYDDALFFADYSRDCIWAIRAGANGRPDPATVSPFVEPRGEPDLRPDRARRRPLLHRLRWRPSSANRLLTKPIADRGRNRHTDRRPRSADGQLQRRQLQRSRPRRHPRLRLGPRRRRRLRRLDRGRPHMELPATGLDQRRAAGHRRRRGLRYRLDPHRRRQRPPGAVDHGAGELAALGGRRGDRLRRQPPPTRSREPSRPRASTGT